MSAAVLFDNVSHSKMICRFSCKIETGTCVLLLTAREEVSHLLARIMTGITLPDSGSLNVLGCSVGESDRVTLMDLRGRIGIIPFSGGLVSNLKVWENIFLPLMYHTGEPTLQDEEVAAGYLKEFEYTGRKMALPAHLSLYEKRVFAFIRAAMMKPELMLYCNSMEKISTPEQKLLLKAINLFHTEKPERTSILVTSSDDVADLQVYDQVLSIHSQ